MPISIASISSPILDNLGVDYDIHDGRIKLPSVAQGLRAVGEVTTPESASAAMMYRRYGLDPDERDEDELVRAIARTIENSDELEIREAIDRGLAESAKRIRSIAQRSPSASGSLLTNAVRYGFVDMDGDKWLCIREGRTGGRGEDFWASDASEEDARSILFPSIMVELKDGQRYSVVNTEKAKNIQGGPEMPAEELLEAVKRKGRSQQLAASLRHARLLVVLAATDPRLRAQRPPVNLRSLIGRYKGKSVLGMRIGEFFLDPSSQALVIEMLPEAGEGEYYGLLSTDLTATKRDDKKGIEYKLSNARLTAYNEQHVPKRRGIDLSPRGAQTYRNVAEFGTAFLRPLAPMVSRVFAGLRRVEAEEGEERQGQPDTRARWMKER